MSSPIEGLPKFIWDEKYRLKLPDGSSKERSRMDTHRRVVKGIYVNDGKDHARRALEAMANLSWNPAGRVHAGAGTKRRVTLINCFVMPDLEDSMETETDGIKALGIMDNLKNSALTQQMGGGIGIDFSYLRPEGAEVVRTGSISGGPLDFMDMWDAMCRTIMSSGSRRGAMMATLICSHPDLLKFIKAKQEKGRLTNFNVSVLITKDFMEALRNGQDWDLGFEIPRGDRNHIATKIRNGKPWYVYQTIPAKELWDIIIRNTYEFAEPGVIFIDRINELNNLYYCEYIHCSNPCGEQPLPPNGDCCLGAVNLAVMVRNTFTPNARVDWGMLENAVQVGMRFLDNVLDVSQFPTEIQKEEAQSKRRIGLGITGLANMLQQLQIRYGSKEAVQVTEDVMKMIRDVAYRASIELAKERGSFLLFDSKKFTSGNFVKTLPDEIQADIKKYGIRNGVLLTIAPTGTTSIYYDNISSGIEPTFEMGKFFRKVRTEDGSLIELETEDYGYRLYASKFPDLCIPGNEAPLPDYMVSTQDLKVKDHLVMQEVCQSYVDASISKTINCPKDMEFEDFRSVYEEADKRGLKGCTTYCPSPVRGSVLSKKSEKELGKSIIMSRPEELSGQTYKIRWPRLDHAFYVTVNDYVDETGMIRPFEIFINSKSVKHQEWITALTRTVSAIFRRGGDVTFLIEELEQIHSSAGGHFIKGKYIPSLVGRIGLVLRQHYEKIGLLEKEEKPQAALDVIIEEVEDQVINWPEGAEICPKCNAPAFYHKEGCQVCESCGFSTCG